MGKSIVIKGADFSAVAVAKVNLSSIPIIPTEGWVDITNEFTWENGKACIYMNGSIQPTSFTKCSNNIDVSRFEKVKLVQPKYRIGPVAENYNALCFYDADENFISAVYYNVSEVEGVPGTEEVIHYIPEGAKYMRTNYWTDDYMGQHPTGNYIPFACSGYKK